MTHIWTGFDLLVQAHRKKSSCQISMTSPGEVVSIAQYLRNQERMFVQDPNPKISQMARVGGEAQTSTTHFDHSIDESLFV